MLHLLHLSRTYLAHHELESEFIAVIIVIDITVCQEHVQLCLAAGWLTHGSIH